MKRTVCFVVKPSDRQAHKLLKAQELYTQAYTRCVDVVRMSANIIPTYRYSA